MYFVPLRALLFPFSSSENFALCGVLIIVNLFLDRNLLRKLLLRVSCCNGFN